MTYVKLNGTVYPATINGKHIDREWNDRESKTITLEMDYTTADALFVDGLVWSILMDVEQPQEDDTIITTQEEYDNSEFYLAGSITDNRDGTLSVKMGKPTEIENILSELEQEVEIND